MKNVPHTDEDYAILDHQSRGSFDEGCNRVAAEARDAWIMRMAAKYAHAEGGGIHPHLHATLASQGGEEISEG